MEDSEIHKLTTAMHRVELDQNKLAEYDKNEVQSKETASEQEFEYTRTTLPVQMKPPKNPASYNQQMYIFGDEKSLNQQQNDLRQQFSDPTAKNHVDFTQLDSKT